MKMHMDANSSGGHECCCGNPWNCFPDEERAWIKSKCPPRVSIPTNGVRPPCRLEVLSESEFKTDVVDMIYSDCWSIYLRKANDHATVKVLYFHNSNTGELTGTREVFGDNPTKLLQSWLRFEVDAGTALELCISLGCASFIDIYYAKLPGGSFMRAEVAINVD
jgi:hypothetical protein